MSMSNHFNMTEHKPSFQTISNKGKSRIITKGIHSENPDFYQKNFVVLFKK